MLSANPPRFYKISISFSFFLKQLGPAENKVVLKENKVFKYFKLSKYYLCFKMQYFNVLMKIENCFLYRQKYFV